MGLLTPASTLPSRAVAPPSHHSKTRRLQPSIILCQKSHGGGDAYVSQSLDRRGVLIGLGGLCGSSAAAHADSTLGQRGTHMATVGASEVVDFVLPSSGSAPKRVRRPAHLVDEAYVAKYKEGIRRMMELPDDDAWNLYRHAGTHPPGVYIGWLFFPWHRLYIHFFERAIGRLIGDDTFALPYWNFDSPDGMEIPAIYTVDHASPLYNATRNPAHLPPAFVDLRYAYRSGDGTALRHEEQVRQNLWEIGMAFRQSLELGPLFAGGPPEQPEEPPYGGRMENLHKTIHLWVGPEEEPWTDFGNPYTTAGDPLFYSLHANMDRLWDIYRGFRGNRDDFTDPKWLDTAFTLRDENGQLVRATIRDALNSDKLGYTYEQVPLPWAGRLPRKPKLESGAPVTFTAIGEFGLEPQAVDWRQPPVRFMVPRPKAGRSKREKEEHVEVLHIQGIDSVPGELVRFDVFVAAPHGDSAGPDHGEYVGNYIKPHVVHPRGKAADAVMKKMMRRKEGMQLGIGPLLEEMDAEGVEKVVVTLLPRNGKALVDRVGIELLQTDGPLLL